MWDSTGPTPNWCQKQDPWRGGRWREGRWAGWVLGEHREPGVVAARAPYLEAVRAQNPHGCQRRLGRAVPVAVGAVSAGDMAPGEVSRHGRGARPAAPRPLSAGPAAAARPGWAASAPGGHRRGGHSDENGAPRVAPGAAEGRSHRRLCEGDAGSECRGSARASFAHYIQFLPYLPEQTSSAYLSRGV